MDLPKGYFGRKLQKRRAALGLTQGGIASRIGVLSQQVSDWERGENLPRTDNIPRLAAALELPVTQIFEWLRGDQEMIKPPAVADPLGRMKELCDLEEAAHELAQIASEELWADFLKDARTITQRIRDSIRHAREQAEARAKGRRKL